MATDFRIADRLVELRRKKGINQEELAEKLGVSRQAVSKWERAESQPDMGNLIALAELYGITLDSLIRGEVEDSPVFSSESASASGSAPVDAPAPSNDPAPSGSSVPRNEPAPPNPEDRVELGDDPRSHTHARPRKRVNPWLSFPYPLLVVSLFLMAGFLFDAWNPAWVLFLTIPFYYWAAAVIAHDEPDDDDSEAPEEGSR